MTTQDPLTNSAQEAQPCRSQHEAITATRAIGYRQFVRYFLGSWAALIIGLVIASFVRGGGEFVALAAVGVALWLQGLSARALAKAKGRDTRWAWGTIFGILALVLMEDRNGAPLPPSTKATADGKSLTEKPDWRLSLSRIFATYPLWIWLIEIIGSQPRRFETNWSRLMLVLVPLAGVALAAWSFHSRLRSGKSTNQAMWHLLTAACLATAALVWHLDRIAHPPTRPPMFRGPFVISLPSAWTENSLLTFRQEKYDFVATHEGELTLRAKFFPLSSPRPALREFADQLIEARSKSFASGVSWAGPDSGIAPGRFIYRLRHAAVGRGDTTTVFCFFEDRKGPCLIEVVGQTPIVEAKLSEIVGAMNGIQSLNR